MANDTITGPKGFVAAGLHCGVKKSGKPDLGLIVCGGGATASAVFTTNKIVSAAVKVCREHVKSRRVAAVVVNSGNANACTGDRGVKDAIKMCAEVGKGLGVDPHEVLVASTGIIGERLPVGKIVGGIGEALGKVSASSAAGTARPAR